jgi:predicted PurR-regulated permease PerM
LINLEGAFSIGSIIGVLSFIPYLGTILGLILALSFSILQMSSFIIIAYILIIFTLGQIIESYILEPKFISKNVGLHPLVGMFMIIAGGAAFGIIGVLLAIPVAAVLAVILFEKE